MTDPNSHNEAEHVADPDGQFSSRESDEAVHNLTADESAETEEVAHDQSNPAEHRSDDHGSSNPGPR